MNNLTADREYLALALDRALVRAEGVPASEAASLLVDVIALTHDVVRERPGVASLAAASHRRDADDVHWPSVTHPGSIVWPAVMTTDDTVSGAAALRAAAIGYEVTVEVAGLFGIAGITRWHRTSVAGQAGAAAAVAFLIDAPIVESVALALTTVSGVGQSVAERASAGAYHRACAARNGADAAAMAADGIGAPVRVLSGDGGVLAACGAGDPGIALERWAAFDSGSTAIGETCLRIYPTNGFAQAAVAAASDVARARPGVARRVTVTVHPVVAQQFSGELVSRHWDLCAAVAATIETGDPWDDDFTSAIPTALVADTATGEGALRPGDATVEAQFDDTTVRATTRREFAQPTTSAALAAEKWRRHAVPDPDQALAVVAGWLGSPRRVSWQQLVDACVPTQGDQRAGRSR